MWRIRSISLSQVVDARDKAICNYSHNACALCDVTVESNFKLRCSLTKDIKNRKSPSSEELDPGSIVMRYILFQQNKLNNVCNHRRL